jgi:N,N-dimethylformamidase beta subunit-like, C-terminal
MLGGAAGDEVDRFDLERGTPRHALRLATSQGGHSEHYRLAIEDVPVNVPGQSGRENDKVRADMTYFETGWGGAVFSTGSITWCGALSHDDFDNDVARITTNVLRRFAAPEPVLMPRAEACSR